jgi:hypothetical protein
MPTKTKTIKPFNMGARQIDCNEYLPDIGDWEETNILFDFGDGWLVCEDRTDYDRRLMAKLTKTCIGTPNYINACFPPVSEEKFWESRYKHFRDRLPEEKWVTLYSRAAIEKKIEQYSYDRYYQDSLKRQLAELNDNDTYEAYIEKQVAAERKMANGKVYGYGPPVPLYRFGHIRDPEGRPMACILFIRADAIKGCPGYESGKFPNASYSTSNDLGQRGFINIEGQDFRIVEVRLGTGRTAPREGLERAAIFYREVVGEWDQEAFEKVNPPMYQAIEVKEDLSVYRRAS